MRSAKGELTFHSAQTAGVRCGDRQATYEVLSGRWIMNNDATSERKSLPLRK